MTTYLINYAHSTSDTPGDIKFVAFSDKDTLNEVRSLVREGYRGMTWANVELSDGRVYIARNQSGKVIGKFI